MKFLRSLPLLGKDGLLAPEWWNFLAGQGQFKPYTPTVTSFTGAFTTLGTVTGRYCKIGNLIVVQYSIPITTNGTAATGILITTPTAIGGIAALVTGRENASTGKAIGGAISGSQILLQYADGTYPGANGALIAGVIAYEAP